MATYVRYEVTRKSIEYRVPVPAAWAEISKAMAAIKREIGDDAASWDDTVQVTVTEDAVVFSFVISRADKIL